MRVFYVETEHFPDRTGPPIKSADELELVADLAYPPANIAVSNKGEVFFTFHPEGNPPYNLVQLVRGKAVPWPVEFTCSLQPLKFVCLNFS